MPQHLLFTIENPDKSLPKSVTLGMDLPDYVDVFWNSDTQTIEASFTPIVPIYQGTRLGEISPYNYCVDTTLHYFTLIPSYPFAGKSERLNSAVCTVSTICDAYIQYPIFTTPSALGATTGTATVRAYTSKPPYYFPAFPPIFPVAISATTHYSIDNGTTWQGSPVFTNLAPGTYTAQIVDTGNCTHSRTFEILAEPVYGIRFFLTYKDSTNATTRIDILKRDYEGAPQEVRPAGNPLIIKERAEGMFSTIRPQECVISLLEFTEDQYIELFTGDDREFRVEVYKEQEMKWAGYVLPDLYQSPYLAPPNAFSFSASDTLGDLKMVPFTKGIPEGILSQWDILMHILQKTNISIPITSGINLYETRMNRSEVDEAMKQAFVSLDAYVENGKVWDCGRVLDAILRPYGAFIHQCNGTWQLTRVEELKSSYIRRNYNARGEFVDYETISPNKLITGPHTGPEAERLFWIEQSQYLELRPAYRQSEVFLNYNKRENLIPGGDIKADDFTKLPDYQGMRQGYEHEHFEGPTRIELIYPDPDKDEPALGIPAFIESTPGLPPTNASADNTYFQTERVFVYKEPMTVVPFYTALRIRIEYRITGGKSSGNNPVFIFSARLNDLYLHPESFLEFSPLFLPGYFQIETEVSSLNSWQTYEITTFDIPEDGWLTLRMHSADINGNTNITGIQYRKISVTPVVGLVPPLANEETFLAKAAGKNTFTPDPVEVTHGDVTPLRNAAIMYRNLIMVNGNTVPSLDWQRRGKSEATPLLQLLADSIISLNETAVKLIRGKLKGAFEWDQVIQEAVPRTRYMPVGFEYNDKENTISSDFMELLGTTQPAPDRRLLLETEAAFLMEDGTYIGME